MRLRFRRGPDRAVMTHGPIVHWMLVVMALSLAIAAGGWAYTVVSLNGKADNAAAKAEANGAQLQAVQESRTDAAIDNCRSLRGLLITLTPVKRRKFADAAINRVGLNDCRAYAKRITALPGG